MKVVKVQKVSLSFGTGDTQKDGTLSGFTTLGKMVPFTASAQISTNSSRIDQTKFDVEITSTTNVRASRGGSGITATVIVYVVEFASDVTVQSGSWSLGSGATTDDNTITSVTLADSFVWHFHKSTASTTQQPNVANTASELQSTTNVRIHVNTSGQAHSGHFYVVSHADLNVQRGSFTSTAPGTPAQTITSVTMANSFVVCSHISSETQYEDEGNGYGELASATTFEWHMGYTEGSNTVYYQVIEDSDMSVQRFATRNTATASGNQTITTVDTTRTVAHAGHMIAVNSSSLYDAANDLNARCTSYDLTTSTNVAWTKTTGNGSVVFEVIQFTLSVAALFTQVSFRGRNDDGSESAATWKAATNTNWNQGQDVNFRSRFLIRKTNTAAAANQEFKLQYNYDSGGWVNITGSSEVVKAVLSTYFADGANTTQQIGSGTYVTPNAGMDEVDGTAGGSSLDFSTTANEEVELEFCLTIQSTYSTRGKTLQLRVIDALSSEPLATYTQTPTLTLPEGAGFIMSTAYKQQFDSGLENPKTITYSKTDMPWGAITLALRAKVGTGGNSLGVGDTFSKIKTTEEITLQDGADMDGVYVDGNVNLTEVMNVTGMTITGILDFSVAGTYTLTNCTIDEVTNSSGGAVTINATNTSITTNTGPNITINNTVNVTVTVKNSDAEAIENARVLVEANTGGSLPSGDTVTITRVSTTATVSHTAHGMSTGMYVVIRNANQPEYNGQFQITVTGVDAYTYTVSGSPATPATGTITATARIMSELTLATGVATEPFNYSTDQPVKGTVRASSTSPYYKHGNFTGEITSSGFSTNVILIGDN